MDDYVGTPARLCIWHVVNGAPFCFVVEPWGLDPIDVDAIVAGNATVRSLMSDVLELATARRLAGAQEPPATIDEVDTETGAVSQVENQDHVAWAAAPGLVAAADPEVTRQLALRAGEDAEPDELPVNPYADLEPVPFEVAPLDGYRVLIQMELDQEVETLLAGMTPAARGEWERAKWWRRDNPVLGALAAALELSREEVNQLFRYAAS